MISSRGAPPQAALVTPTDRTHPSRHFPPPPTKNNPQPTIIIGPTGWYTHQHTHNNTHQFDLERNSSHTHSSRTHQPHRLPYTAHPHHSTTMFPHQAVPSVSAGHPAFAPVKTASHCEQPPARRYRDKPTTALVPPKTTPTCHKARRQSTCSSRSLTTLPSSCSTPQPTQTASPENRHSQTPTNCYTSPDPPTPQLTCNTHCAFAPQRPRNTMPSSPTTSIPYSSPVATPLPTPASPLFTSGTVSTPPTPPTLKEP